MGMKDLPLDNGRKITRAFERLGWESRQGKGHFVLLHTEKPRLNISIPDHKEVDRALLRSELRKAGISPEDFLKAYNKG